MAREPRTIDDVELPQDEGQASIPTQTAPALVVAGSTVHLGPQSDWTPAPRERGEPRTIWDSSPPAEEEVPFDPAAPARAGEQPVLGVVTSHLAARVGGGAGLEVVPDGVGGYRVVLATDELETVPAQDPGLWVVVWRAEDGSYFKVDFSSITAQMAALDEHLDGRIAVLQAEVQAEVDEDLAAQDAEIAQLMADWAAYQVTVQAELESYSDAYATFQSGMTSDYATFQASVMGELSSFQASVNATIGDFDDRLLALEGTTIAWDNIINKPATFPPSAHSHAWADLTDPPATYAPSAHTHPVAEVTGLQAALDDKLPLAGGAMTGKLMADFTAGSIGSAVNGADGIEIQSAGAAGDAAYLTFHRSGSFAARFGLDTDNKWKVGGWSYGAGVAHEVWHAGTFNPATKANLAGGNTFTGTQILSGTTNYWQFYDTDNNINRYIHHSAGDFGFLDSAGGWSLRQTDAGWLYLKGGAQIATDGNLYMPWAGAWLSVVLSHKVHYTYTGSGIQIGWDGAGLYAYVDVTSMGYLIRNTNFTTYFTMRWVGHTNQLVTAGGVNIYSSAWVQYGITISYSPAQYRCYFMYLQWYWNGTWYTVGT
jgi:hypothetical protein